MSDVVSGLSNEEYHRGADYACYLSSTQLKWYARSPRYARYMMGHPQEQTDAMRFGSLFHDAIVSFQQHGSIEAFYDSVVIFKAPVNEKTDQPYGNTTKTYKEALLNLQTQNAGKEIVTVDEVLIIDDMVGSMLFQCGSTSEQVRKLLKWGKPEVSIFHETEDGIKLKVRPDLLTNSKIIDWKTTNSSDLSEDAINRMILTYGYHISAAMYQWVAHEVLGKWLTFYLVFVSKEEPHDCVMVDMSNYGYRYQKELDMVSPGCGAIEFRRLLDLHTRCTKENRWPGAETFISGDRHKILEINPPGWYERKFIEEY